MAGPRKKKALTVEALMARDTWQPLPSVLVLVGNAPYLKTQALERLTREIFGDAEADLRRFAADGSQGNAPSLATVLDELRTPSFFSASRVVVLDAADSFVTEHSATLLEHIEQGFSGGHLVILQTGFDQRTRWAKNVGKKGWVVECRQPYDRPPPWDTRTPIWDSELSSWVSRHARTKGVVLRQQEAFLLHDRVGTDLAILDEELEKLATYVGARTDKTINRKMIEAVVGDLREHSLFQLVDLVLERRLPDALDSTRRLFERGQQSDRGTRAVEPMSIALPFISTLAGRLRTLRQAHALKAAGEGGSETWLRHGLVQRPFLARFERQLEATHPAYIRSLFRRLYEVDRALKLGANPEREIELLVAQFSAPERTRNRATAGPQRN